MNILIPVNTPPPKKKNRNIDVFKETCNNINPFKIYIFNLISYLYSNLKLVDSECNKSDFCSHIAEIK